MHVRSARRTKSLTGSGGGWDNDVIIGRLCVLSGLFHHAPVLVACLSTTVTYESRLRQLNHATLPALQQHEEPLPRG